MLVYGKNVCYQYLKNTTVTKIYLDKQFNDTKILELLPKNVKYVDKFFLDKICQNGLHQGIAIEVPDYQYADLHDYLDIESSLLIVLDHLEDPHNLGAIIRTAEAAGVTGIIIPKNRSVEVNATVLKTSVGTALKVPIFQVTNLNDTLTLLKKHGFWVIGTDMQGTDFKTLDYRGKTVLVIGNEGKGMSELVRKNCDFIATIPMYGTVNSLNASVATALMIYEAVRQTHS